MIKKSSLEPIDYDDILLIPNLTDVDSRSDVAFNLRKIINSPMPIFGVEFLKTLRMFGVSIALHRFFEKEEDRLTAIEQITDFWPNTIIAVGMDDVKDENFLEFLGICGVQTVMLDVANGYMTKVHKCCEILVDRGFFVISGNVVERQGFNYLAKNGCSAIRVGIGGGSPCSTRNFAGIGCPDLTAIRDCAENNPLSIPIIADGGISDSGRAIKAFAFGADMVMIGGLFARAIESGSNGIYYGASSHKNQSRMKKPLKSNEGIELSLTQRPIEEIISEFVWGIKSGLSYLGVRSVEDLQDANVEYIRTGKNTLKNLSIDK